VGEAASVRPMGRFSLPYYDILYEYDDGMRRGGASGGAATGGCCLCRGDQA
jgi:hypothetical protein